jgi:hypothetical protein
MEAGTIGDVGEADIDHPVAKGEVTGGIEDVELSLEFLFRSTSALEPDVMAAHRPHLT